MSHKKQTRCNGRLIEININSDADESVFGEIFVERDYRILDRVILNARSPIIDIGAHTGMFSIYCACFNPGMRIFAYEPDVDNFAAMKENLKMNNVRNVVMKNVAVSASGSERFLYLSSDSHNHSIISAEAAGDFSGVEKKVQSVTLERIVAQNRLARVSLVKMDCEGAEFEILEGLAGDSRRHSALASAGHTARRSALASAGSEGAGKEVFDVVENFYIEYHQYSDDMKAVRLREILQKNGFKVEMKTSFYDRRMGFIWARGKNMV